MWLSREPRFDVACAISQGARNYQEDAITSDFIVGADAGFVVLADGMGGHAAGDIASKLVLTEVYSELKFQYADVDVFEADAPAILRKVANLANDRIKEHVSQHPETHGMGATLIAPVILENRLFWISVGDSPLYLLRKRKLTQLNEDHSMAPQIDLMVSSGLMDPEVAECHPDRNCLTSVIMGQKIPKVDCPEKAMELQAGDIILCASDGVQFLPNKQIQRVLAKNSRKRATEISEQLLNELKRLDDPDQDNITFCVIKVNDVKATPLEERQRRRPSNIQRPTHVTTLIEDTDVIEAEPEKIKLVPKNVPVAEKKAKKPETDKKKPDKNDNSVNESDKVLEFTLPRVANSKE